MIKLHIGTGYSKQEINEYLNVSPIMIIKFYRTMINAGYKMEGFWVHFPDVWEPFENIKFGNYKVTFENNECYVEIEL